MGQLNILLVEYINRNLGDTVIPECTEFLLKEALKRAGISEYFIHEYNMYRRDLEFISCADLIVFAGGGLIKFQREKFHRYVSEIIETAQQKDIPVFINATGVEGYDEQDQRCQRLKQALNLSCVKGITVRDDLNTLKKFYLQGTKEWLEKVMDPASCAAEVYHCKAKKTKIIGLGICRPEIFSAYGHKDITKEFLLQFWCDVIRELERRGYQWQMFGNGLYRDWTFAKEILTQMGLEEVKYLAERPVEGKDLADIISQYQGIIAPRLHANIIAYSLEIPSIGLVWNDKLIIWGENIGHPERFVYLENESVITVVNRLEQAIQNGVRRDENEKEKLIFPLSSFFMKYGMHKRKEESEHRDGYRLIANALGGFRFQYSCMNSSVIFKDKYEKGLRWFETDLSVTSDGRIVCVNGWNENTYILLDQEDKGAEGLTYDEFIHSRYYSGHFPTMDLKTFLDMQKNYSDIQVIFDIRNANKEKNKQILLKLEECLNKGFFSDKKPIIRINSAKDFTFICTRPDLLKRVQIMYDAPQKYLENQEIYHESAIKYISVRNNIRDSEMMDYFQKVGKPICIFSTDKIHDILFYRPWSCVSMIATNYLVPENLRICNL